MEVRSGYKQTEIGVIPEDWEIYKVSQFTLAHKQGFYTKNPYVPEGVKLARITDLFFNKINFDDMPSLKISEDDFKQYKISEGDFLFARSGAIGRYGIVSEPVKAIFGSYIIRFVFNAKLISNHFFGYAYQAEFTNKQLLSITQGSSNININAENIKALKIPIPKSKIEQDAIAKALSDADALIESLEKLIEKKRQIKQGAMQELLTGKKRLPGFSGEWQVKSLGQLFMFTGGYSASRDQLSFDGYCYLHYGDIHSSKNTFIDVDSGYSEIPKLKIPLSKVSASSLLDDGDVVFVDASEDDEGASRHVVVINPNQTPFISGLHTIVAKRKTSEIHSLFLRYCFQTLEIKSQFKFYAVGTKVSGISKTNIAKIKLKFPIEVEQIEIAKILSDMDLELSQLEQKLSKARQIKQGMMQELLTGRIRLV